MSESADFSFAVARVVAERDELRAENERLRVENEYMRDTSPACAVEAVKAQERAVKAEAEVERLRLLLIDEHYPKLCALAAERRSLQITDEVVGKAFDAGKADLGSLLYWDLSAVRAALEAVWPFKTLDAS